MSAPRTALEEMDRPVLTVSPVAAAPAASLPALLQEAADLLPRVERLATELRALAGAAGTLSMRDRCDRVVDAVAEATGVKRQAIVGRCRQDRCVWARHLTWWIAQELLAVGQSELARMWRRDHGTVGNGVRQARARVQTSDVWRSEHTLAVEIARRRLGRGSIKRLTEVSVSDS